jgi:hypothetical protein
MPMKACGALAETVRAPIAPGDKVGDELWAQQIEELGAHREPHLDDLEQQAARHLQALVDRKAAVQVRVVDVALPAERRPRLLEVGAHDDEQRVLQRARFVHELGRVLDRLIVVVDRARADDDDQSVVLPLQHARQRLAALLDELQRRVRAGQLFHQQRGGDERAHGIDARVVDARRVARGAALADLAVVEGVVDRVHARLVGRPAQHAAILEDANLQAGIEACTHLPRTAPNRAVAFDDATNGLP